MQDFYSRVLEEVDPQGSGPEGSAENFAAWAALAPHVEPVLDRLISGTPSSEPFKEDGKELLAKSGVIVDNSTVPDIDRLTYSKIADGQPSVTVIAIGGNTLTGDSPLKGWSAATSNASLGTTTLSCRWGAGLVSATDTATSRGFGPPSSFFTGSESSMLSRTSSGLNLSG